MTKFNRQELKISNNPDCTCISPKLNSNKPILYPKSGTHLTEAEGQKPVSGIMQLVKIEKGIPNGERHNANRHNAKRHNANRHNAYRHNANKHNANRLNEKGLTQKGITQIGITRKGITQIGITQIGSS